MSAAEKSAENDYTAIERLLGRVTLAEIARDVVVDYGHHCDDLAECTCSMARLARLVIPAASTGGESMPDLTRRHRLSLWWLAFRRRWRRCPECSLLGYGNDGPGPGRTYRWVDDPIVQRLGFPIAPHRCNTCGQKPEEAR